MSALSIILRILTIGACLAALYLWTDKQQVIAQKEAIIQEREYLVGYPKMERPKGDEVTMNNEVRGETFAVIEEDRPHDPSYQRLEQLRNQLKEIQALDRDYGYGVREIGGYDPNKSLTLRTHIEEQSKDIEQKKKQISGLNQDLEKVKKELREQKELLGDEIQKVAELKEQIVQKDEAYSDLNFKHEQFKNEFDEVLRRIQEKLAAQRAALGAQIEAVRIQLTNSQASEAQLKLEVARLNQTIAALRHQLHNTPESQNISKDDSTVGDDKKKEVNPDRKKTNTLQLHTRFYQYKKQSRHLIILAGTQSGIKKFDGKLVDVKIGSQMIEGLQILRITEQYSILLLPTKLKPTARQTLEQVKSMAEVTVKVSSRK